MGAFSSFFALISYSTDRPWAALSSDLEDYYCGNNDFMFVYMEIVRDQLNVCKSEAGWYSTPSTEGAAVVA